MLETRTYKQNECALCSLIAKKRTVIKSFTEWFFIENDKTDNVSYLFSKIFCCLTFKLFCRVFVVFSENFHLIFNFNFRQMTTVNKKLMEGVDWFDVQATSFGALQVSNTAGFGVLEFCVAYVALHFALSRLICCR